MLGLLTHPNVGKGLAVSLCSTAPPPSHPPPPVLGSLSSQRDPCGRLAFLFPQLAREELVLLLADLGQLFPGFLQFPFLLQHLLLGCDDLGKRDKDGATEAQGMKNQPTSLTEKQLERGRVQVMRRLTPPRGPPREAALSPSSQMGKGQRGSS